MKKFLQPTLVRRVVLALLLAFLLVWSVLVAYEFVHFKQAMARDQGLAIVTRAVAAALGDLSEPNEAAAAAKVTATQFNALRTHEGVLPGRLLFELRDHNDRRLSASPELGVRTLAGETGHVVERTLDHQVYWLAQETTPRWVLRVAEPKISDSWVLMFFGRQLVPYLLIAFPIVLLPVWIAASQGLRPLRRLAERISLRQPGDLAPLGVTPKYAELKPLVAGLESMMEQLRGKVQRERAFVQDAAHELKTPMAVIAAQAHVLVLARGDAERHQARAQLDAAIARASHVVGQLLELAALDDAQQRPAHSIDVAQRVRSLLAQAAGPALARNIELSFEAPDSLVAHVDAGALHSVVQNLLDNALRYVHAGGRVIATLQQENGALTLSVADDGPGIPPAQRERVFERFYRDHTHDMPGSGLGLAIVKQALLRMGGHVALRDGLSGRGCNFVATLPVAATC